MGKCIKIRSGHYLYKGYKIINQGYYPPEHCVYWEAVNPETGWADFHAKTKKFIMFLIDESEKRYRICGNCDAFCECGLGINGARHDDVACKYFDDTVLKQLKK